MSEKYEKFACGVVLLRAENANWNADFSGYPRRLPDEKSTFYSTDKALKYAIRKYLKEVEGKGVLFWRQYSDEGNVVGLEEMLEQAELIEKQGKEKKIKIKKLLEDQIDCKLFGGTFAVSNMNFSITGPVQITYGVDIWNNGEAYVNQIMSPKQEKKGKQQSTLGSEVRLTEAHYSFDFTINPNNLLMDTFLNKVLGGEKECLYLQKDDIDAFKRSLRLAPNYLTSTTKTGVVSELVVFAEFKMDESDGKRVVPLIPILKHLVKVEMGEGYKRTVVVDTLLSKLVELGAEKVEVFYDPEFTVLQADNASEVVSKYNIVTGEQLK